MPFSQFFRVSYTNPPPPLLPTWRPSEAFPLPTYHEAMAVADFEDSMRLPNYQSRHLKRYHPYWQYKPSPQSGDGLEYQVTVDSHMSKSPTDFILQNTIYDEQYTPLIVPSRVDDPPPSVSALYHLFLRNLTLRQAPPRLSWGTVFMNVEMEDRSDALSAGLSLAERARRSRRLEEARWARIYHRRARLGVSFCRRTCPAGGSFSSGFYVCYAYVKTSQCTSSLLEVTFGSHH